MCGPGGPEMQLLAKKKPALLIEPTSCLCSARGDGVLGLENGKLGRGMGVWWMSVRLK